jgi:voltage-gated potassium channel
MWWALVTLATVGYGDVFPVTAIGRLQSGIVVIVGIVIFALPTVIFASGFVEEIQKNQEHYCPHCKKKVQKYSLKSHKHLKKSMNLPGSMKNPRNETVRIREPDENGSSFSR